MIIRVRLDTRTRRFRDGRVVLGGSPLRLLRLSRTGAEFLDGWAGGDPVGDRPGERRLAERMMRAGVVHPIGDGPASRDVTVVVPVKDDQWGLRKLLAATGVDAHRSIVVDDGSAVPVPGAAVRHATARGPAAARNAGYRLARTGLVAFLDSDTTPEPGWLDGIAPLFDDPAVAAVAPRIRSHATGIVGVYESSRSCLDMGPEPANVHPGGRVRYVPTAALVVRRAELEAVGGFDETLRYGEDVDLVWRLVSAGYVVRYQPDSVVWHEPRATVRDWLRQRVGYGTSAAPLARRHPELLYCARFSGAGAVQYLSLAAGYPVVGLAVGILAAVHKTYRLHGHDIPWPAAARTAAMGELGAANQAAEALRRVWWPIALLTGRGRKILAAAYIPALCEAILRGRGARWMALRVADDAAYGLGVWFGCVRAGNPEPLLPGIGRVGGAGR